VMVGLTSFLPTYVQGAGGHTALVAGFTLSAMSIGWPLAATITGRVLVRVGPQRLTHIGGVAVFLGGVISALAAPWGILPLAAGAFVMGLGFGIMNTTILVAIQSTVPWNERGAATASNMLMRLTGNVLGVALFGGVLNGLLRHHLETGGLAGRFSIDSVQGLLERSGGAAANLVAGPEGNALRAALAASLEGVFWCAAAASVITLVIALRMPPVHLHQAGVPPAPQR